MWPCSMLQGKAECQFCHLNITRAHRPPLDDLTPTTLGEASIVQNLDPSRSPEASQPLGQPPVLHVGSQNISLRFDYFSI